LKTHQQCIFPDWNTIRQANRVPPARPGSSLAAANVVKWDVLVAWIYGAQTKNRKTVDNEVGGADKQPKENLSCCQLFPLKTAATIITIPLHPPKHGQHGYFISNERAVF